MVALVVALGGTSYAAVTLAKNSVKAKHIALGAVGTSDVKDGSLLKKDFKAGQLPQGPQGPAGRSALTELKPGETIRGYVGGDHHSAGAAGDWRASASFAIPGKSVPAKVYINNITPGETCAGSTAAPTAPAGTLCVYLGGSANPRMTANSHEITNQSKFGFQVSWSPIGAGDTWAVGSYAYNQG
jgi:hypothetical protein